MSWKEIERTLKHGALQGWKKLDVSGAQTVREGTGRP